MRLSLPANAPLTSLALNAAFLGCVLVLTAFGLLAPIDQLLRDLRFAATDRAPSGQTAFVEIDAQSLASVGVWPWPRQIHAEVLDRLMALGAAEVVFDIDFSTASTAENDLALEQALERAGGYALLAAFQQTNSDGSAVLNTPLARFAAHSEPVLVNVDGDGTQLLRSVPAIIPNTPIRSLAAALASNRPPEGTSIAIDYGINLKQIDRIPVSELLAGAVDPTRIQNRQIVVGASAVELRDFFRVPRFGVIPGPLVQLAAAETLKSGRSLRDLGSMPAWSLAVLAFVALVLLRRRLSLSQMIIAAAGLIVAVEIASWLALLHWHISLDTAVFHLSALALLLATLLHDRAMHWREIFRQQARLAYLASHDEVTGALSRQAMLLKLDGQLANGSATVIMVQLGRLDGAVAALGHDVGDAIATQVAQRLERQLGHTVARIADDVFAWSQPEQLDATQQVALCRWIASWLDMPYAVGGHSVVLDTIFGSSTGSAPSSPAELLRQAEVALGQARATSLKAMPFTPAQSERINERRLRHIALHEALERGEFFLLYQSQVDLATGEMLGVEALVRWQNDSLGLVSPADFIPLAEETGLIVKLGDWILHEACRQAAGWSWSGRLSVNVSSAQFRLSDVVASVRSALAQSGFPAHRLDLELTESLFVDGDPAIVQALDALRRLGIGIALDDFGTGYSSLSYLSRLPVDKLKIDQSFIRCLPDPGNEAIVETIMLMAKRLGKMVVAEGVETAQQQHYLAALGCDVGQGYLFSRPSTPLDLDLLAPEAAAA